MPLTITVTRAYYDPATGSAQYDDYGTPQLSSVTKTYRARLEPTIHRVTTRTGEEAIATMKLFLACQDILSIDDEISLPEGINPQGKPILAVSPVYDEDGLHHTVVSY